MSEEIRRPLHRKDLTGRHADVSSDEMQLYRRLQRREQQKAIRDFPEEARLIRSMLDSFDFSTVQTMYENINLRSAGPLKPEKQEPPTEQRVRSIPKVATAKVTREEVFFCTAKSAKEMLGEDMGMAYVNRSNVFVINLGHHSVSALLENSKKLRPLNEKDEAEAEYDLYNFYHGIFHELGHAYGYISSHRHTTPDLRSSNNRISVSTRARRTHRIPGTDRAHIKEFVGLEYWMEGFNDMQTLFRMRKYMDSHTLSFQDISVPIEKLEDYFWRSMHSSWYGPAAVAIDEIMDHISTEQEIPYPDVFNAFTKIYQTKGGNDTLSIALEKLLGPDLTVRIVGAGSHGWDADVLSRDIASHLKASKNSIDFIESIMTTPGRWKGSNLE